MTPAELDELERLVATARGKDKWLACVVEDNPNLIAEHLPALIAKVRAADALAEAVETKLSYSTGPVVVAAAAYRKAQP